MTIGVRVCPSCAAALAEAAAFCHVCGAATGAYTAAAPSNETRERLVVSLGRDYQLRELLGSGGFAEVYLAWDSRLKREVAIKTLRSELTDSQEVRERFRREAEAIAQLRHPHIVPIYSVAEGGDSAWFVMPRIDGASLATALERESHWTFAEVCRILREASGALASAHASGIVHRDIKPENIMLEGPERRVVLMDFGIAKSVDDTSAVGLTGTGMMIGTPLYMSPEQAAGDPAGPASDQYSLGLVGYRLLTGQVPFKAESLRSLMMMQASVPPAPVRDYRPDVPAALATVIERALAKDPSQRFASMQDVADALDRVARDVAGEYRRGRRTAPMAERWTESLRRVSRGWRPAFVAIVTGAAAVVTAMPYTFSSGVHRALRERDDALFAARAMMAAEGHRAAPVSAGFTRNRAVFAHLQRARPIDVADSLAYGAFHVWQWKYDFEYPGGARWLYFGKDARMVLDYRFIWDDSLKVGGISPDEARRMADSVLRAAGEKPEDLVFDRIETSPSPRYTSQKVIWHRKDPQVVFGGDTAVVAVSVEIAARFPIEFAREGQVRGSSRSTALGAPAWALTIAFPFVMIALGLATLIALVRRAASDVLQWRMALWTSAVLVVLWLAIVTYGGFSGIRGISSFAKDLTQQMPMLLSFWILTAGSLVLGESLWYESRPDLTAGLDDLTRGKFRVPEWIPATLFGYAWGLSLVAVAFTVFAISHAVFNRPYLADPTSLRAFTNRLPWAAPVLPFAFGIVVCSVLLSLMGLFRRRLGLLAIVSTIALALMAAAFIPVFDPFAGVALAILILIPACIMRAGYLAGVMAVGVAFGFPVALDFLWVGGPFLWAGIIGMLLLLAPAAWAMRLRLDRR